MHSLQKIIGKAITSTQMVRWRNRLHRQEAGDWEDRPTKFHYLPSVNIFLPTVNYLTRGKYFLLDKVIHLGSHISSHMDPSHTQKLISLAGDQESM